MKFGVIKENKWNLKFWHDYYYHLSFWYNLTLFNSLIFRGNSLLAFKFYCKLKNKIKLKGFYDFNFILLIAMMNITPKVNLRIFRFGSSNKKVPFPITEQKQISLAVKWIKSLSKDKNRAINLIKLVELLISSLYNKGSVVEKKKRGI